MKFKIGDKIKIKNVEHFSDYRKHQNDIGEILSDGDVDTFDWWVLWPGGEKSRVKESNIELCKYYPLSMDYMRGLDYAITTTDECQVFDWPKYYNCFWPDNQNNKKPMNKLNSMMKRLLDADTKTLIKAGYINGDLLLTQEGKEALDAIVFEANKEALVKLAEEKIVEEKEVK